jgi:hypothetical protein
MLRQAPRTKISCTNFVTEKLSSVLIPSALGVETGIAGSRALFLTAMGEAITENASPQIQDKFHIGL